MCKVVLQVAQLAALSSETVCRRARQYMHILGKGLRSAMALTATELMLRCHVQTDKKSLGAKAMLLEIKEANEKRRREEAGQAAAVPAPLAPTPGRHRPDLIYSRHDL